MHAYLLVGTYLQEKISQLVSQLNSQRMDFSLTKISDVRDLKGITKISLGQKTTIVIENFHLSSEETQNAFLKELEEPQSNLSFILTTENLGAVLPTITSRCEIIELTTDQPTITEEAKKVVDKFLTGTVGEKLKITSNIKDRGEATTFLENLIYILHQNLIEGDNNTRILEQATKTLLALKQNGNIQLQLTNFIIQTE